MPQNYHCHILEHRVVGHNLRVMTLQPVYRLQDPSFDCQAGQFVMVDLPTERFFFRRPFSVMAVYEDGVFDLFYKIVGQGTEMMSQLQPGDETEVLGPLGNCFSSLSEPETALLIGGGIGIAPMICLGQALQKAGKPTPLCFYGVRSQQEIGLLSELFQIFGADRVFVSTDDGSYGFHGNIGQLLSARPEYIQVAKEALICGPTPMMSAVSRLLLEQNSKLRVEVSLEEHMPCGTGACTGCVVTRRDRRLPSKTCVEGPIFEARTICWPGEMSDPLEETTRCSL